MAGMTAAAGRLTLDRDRGRSVVRTDTVSNPPPSTSEETNPSHDTKKSSRGRATAVSQSTQDRRYI